MMGLIGGMVGAVVELSKESKADQSTGRMTTNTADKRMIKAGSYT